MKNKFNTNLTLEEKYPSNYLYSSPKEIEVLKNAIRADSLIGKTSDLQSEDQGSSPCLVHQDYDGKTPPRENCYSCRRLWAQVQSQKPKAKETIKLKLDFKIPKM